MAYLSPHRFICEKKFKCFTRKRDAGTLFGWTLLDGLLFMNDEERDTWPFCESGISTLSSDGSGGVWGEEWKIGGEVQRWRIFYTINYSERHEFAFETTTAAASDPQTSLVFSESV